MSVIQTGRRCILYRSSQAMYIILNYKKKCLLFLAFFSLVKEVKNLKSWAV